MKKPILILLALVACSGLILLTLDKLMGSQAKSLHGFQRKFTTTSLNKIKDYTLEKPVYSIAGWNSTQLFLSTATPGEIIILDINKGTTKTKKITIEGVDKLSSTFHTTVNYPEIFIAGTNARKIIRGNLLTGTAEIYNVNSGPVLSAVITDRDNAIIRYIDTNSLELYFKPLNFVTGSGGKPVKVAPVVNNDIFAYDGYLNYDRILKQVSYVNFYCNGITRFDEKFHQLNRSTTIDTMNSPKVSIAHLSTAVTNSAAPQMINKNSSLHDGMLYVQSALKADNEKPGMFENNTVIDMYSNAYRGSFYLPAPAAEIIQFVMMDQGRAVVLTDKSIQLYALQ
jgi:hypothetical protein